MRCPDAHYQDLNQNPSLNPSRSQSQSPSLNPSLNPSQSQSQSQSPSQSPRLLEEEDGHNACEIAKELPYMISTKKYFHGLSSN